MKNTPAYIVCFVLLVVFQLFVLDNLHVNGLYNAYAYIWFILCLPYSLPSTVLVLVSFATGLTIDLFSGTAGMHALACSVMGYTRFLLLKSTSRTSDKDRGKFPSLVKKGFSWYFEYAVPLVLIHHFCLFLVEAWSFNGFLHMLLRVLCSSALTLALVFSCEVLFTEKEKS